MTIEICIICDKNFNYNDGFPNDKRSITCVECLKSHFELTELLYKKIIKDKKGK